MIGLVGGIGAGKSTVAELLVKEYGYVLLKTDDIAKQLYEPDGPAYAPLVQAFGDRILGPDGRIDRIRFAAVLNENAENRKLSDSIVHPLVFDYTEKRGKELEQEGRKVVAETALPSQRFVAMCSSVICVFADREVRIARLMEDRGYSRSYAESIMDSQLSDEAFFLMADTIVDNSGTKEETRKALAGLL